ncbi:methyl-accepting chemotaxis protein [Inhella crocodyli]|uniref:Methyl-accepting chemotaxis protein n=1 Tax=Inhella crocodyli TaxID=2499851 RepID=A0A3S2UH21_9BURK|nr:methyl-accepting chemotaxis protein [Inhella crocodyli]RVT87565.1 methyl-accepting chemotaxis protein [Inhella crocodyli]
MALVLKSRDSQAAPAPAATAAKGISRAMTRDAEANRRRARTLAKQQQAAERIASASTQLSAGVNEAASAAEELKRASDQIASGAEEAAGAAQESLAAMTQVSGALKRQLEACNTAQTNAEGMRDLAGQLNLDVSATITAVGVAAERQAVSVQMVGELERQAANIGDIVKAVARIADQTNLLALNAAIEAARAGLHGKGFAVVADEVRTLAETSEKSAKQIQDLVGQIQGEVKLIADGINSSAESIQSEVTKSKVILDQLEQVRLDAGDILQGAVQIASAAAQGAAAAQQALKGAEQIAAAATEQSSACEEAAKTVEEQSAALAECEQTTANLSEIADELKHSTDIGKSAEEVASAAEELASTVQELTRSAGQIMVALDQIRKGAQSQAAATAESAAAIAQIAKGAELAEQRAEEARARSDAIRTLMQENKARIDGLVRSISDGVSATRTSMKQVKELELVSRKIDKIVDAITQVSVQTNMLAVNGNVEAARAGEYGKGFVVVATDIRNLAHDSAENADRIKDLVKGIQDQIGTVGRDLGEIVTAAVAEVDKAKGITANLNALETSVGRVMQGNDTAMESSREINAALAEVRTGVEQISSAAAQSEKAAEQAAAAAKQQSQGADELAAAIEEISSLADELQSN